MGGWLTRWCHTIAVKDGAHPFPHRWGMEWQWRTGVNQALGRYHTRLAPPRCNKLGVRWESALCTDEKNCWVHGGTDDVTLSPQRQTSSTSSKPRWRKVCEVMLGAHRSSDGLAWTTPEMEQVSPWCILDWCGVTTVSVGVGFLNDFWIVYGKNCNMYGLGIFIWPC